MSDGLNPTGPAQPTLDSVYETSGNAASKTPADQSASQANAQSNSAATDTRVPTKQTSSIDEATPTSMARGVRGAPPGEEAAGYGDDDVGRSNELTAEQMAASGEGEVRDVVEKKPGATGGAPGLETDLDAKKAEQAEARDQVKSEKQEKLDVGGILGKRGGPASTAS